jgi:pSer/pThr/pTyr-binding forkhead associated (FHA) protein
MSDKERSTSGAQPRSPAALQTTPGEAPSTSEQPAPEPEPPKEEKTQPLRLKDLAPKLAQKRRRTTAAELTFKRGKNAAEVRVPLERSETVIGRDPVCDIVLAEKSASARHARIRRTAGGFYEVEDLGSTNGVFVDGDRVEKMTLLDGDSFTIGDTKFSILIAPVVGEEG